MTLSETTLQFLTGTNVFSRKKLDEGTSLLLETMFDTLPIRMESTIGDLGCGWGAVGAFCAQRWPESEVVSVDINPRAAQLTHQNFNRNLLSNATAWCGDGFSALRSHSLDLVAVNPPVRAGNAVIERMFDDAGRVLREQGELWVVLRTAQGAKSWQKRLANRFGSCETIQIQKGFRILHCSKSSFLLP